MKVKLIPFILFVLGNYLAFSQGLVVEPNSNIKVLSGTTLKIADGDLLLKSDDSGDASLIDLGAVSYNNGEGNVQRYLIQGTWKLVSSPVATATADVFGGEFLQYYSEATSVWTDITTLSHPLTPMQGFSTWSIGTGSSTKLFEGITNTGPQSFAFTNFDWGYNLVGNPYPSVIDWDAVNIPAGMSGAFWIFDPTLGTNGDYRYYLEGGGGANTTNQYIALGQGFFIKAETGPGNLQFDNTVRGVSNQQFYKNTASNPMLVLKALGNGHTTQTAIRFNKDATSLIDRLFDVQKLVSYSPDVPVIYTICENTYMAINTLHSLAGNETMPVYFEAGQSGTYEIEAAEIESLDPQLSVYLEDVSQNYFQDLRVDPNYSFTYTTGSQRNFNVHFSNVTGIDDNKPNPEEDISCFMTSQVVHVVFSPNFFELISNEAIIEVFNITGQQVLRRQTSNLNNEIPLHGSAAVYFVRISYAGQIITKKVFNH